jgi:hypothetical protein
VFRSGELNTCASCRATTAKSTKKRKALQPLDPNLPAKRRPVQHAKALTSPETRPELTLRLCLHLYLDMNHLSLYLRYFYLNLNPPSLYPRYLHLNLNPLSLCLRHLYLDMNPLSLYLWPLLYNLKHQASFLLTNGHLYRVLIKQ